MAEVVVLTGLPGGGGSADDGVAVEQDLDRPASKRSRPRLRAGGRLAGMRRGAVLAKFEADHEARLAPKSLRPAPHPLETDVVDLSLLPVSDVSDHGIER